MQTRLIPADMDDFSYRLECGIALVDSVRTSIEEGSSQDIEGWGRAAYGATLYLSSLSCELKDAVEQAYKDGCATESEGKTA